MGLELICFSLVEVIKARKDQPQTLPHYLHNKEQRSSREQKATKTILILTQLFYYWGVTSALILILDMKLHITAKLIFTREMSHSSENKHTISLKQEKW